PGSIATEKKIYIGKGTKYYPRINVAEFIVETGNIKKGDTIMISGPICGMVKENFETLIVNGEEGNEAKKGDKITFPFAVKVTAKDKLYKIVASEYA
ncbi:MAG: U32 family peptidase, partial [Ferruginibacter sp.]